MFLGSFSVLSLLLNQNPTSPNLIYFSKYQVFPSRRSLLFLCFRLSPSAWNKRRNMRFSEVFFYSVRVRVEQVSTVLLQFSQLSHSFYRKRQSDKQTADAPNDCNFPFMQTAEPFRILLLLTVSASDQQSANTTKPDSSSG